MVIVSAKTGDVCIQTEIHFIELICIATLNNYVCLLSPLTNVNWSAFSECLYRPFKSTTGEMAPMDGLNLAIGT